MKKWNPSVVLITTTIVVLLSIAASMALQGCKWENSASNWQQTAYIKLGNSPDPVPNWVAEKSKYDFVCLTFGAWADPVMQNVGERMKAQNPTIRLGTYVSTHACPPWMRDAPATTFAGRWWRELSPYLARTTEGDTAAIFKDAYFVDVTNPQARAAMVAITSEYVTSTGLSWAMLDFFSVPMPDLKWGAWVGIEHGDLDLDGDGVGHWQDADEQQELRAAFESLIAEYRAALPKGFLLIPNGALAITDPTFSKLVDGCYVEGFPRWFFGSGDRMNYGAALDPARKNAVPDLVTPGRWHSSEFFVMLEDCFDSGQIGYIAALYPHLVEMKRAANDVDVRSPLDLSFLGMPTGFASYKAPQTTRTFEHGVVVVTAGDGTLSTTAR